jgi:TPR repeat protein
MLRACGALAAIAMGTALVAPAAAQTDSSAWTSERVTTPMDRAGGAKLLKSAPGPTPGQGGAAATGPVFTTRAPSAGPESGKTGAVPQLPSSPPAGPVSGDSTVAKTGAGADPAYEAFDLGRYVTALELAKAAAERGEPQAATLIGRIYQEGLGVGRDDVQAAQWYRRGVELGDTNAMFAFGVLLADGGAANRKRRH